jgi:hypothetical protein
LAATIASFLVARARDGRVVSRSLATLVLIQFRFRSQRALLISGGYDSGA